MTGRDPIPRSQNDETSPRKGAEIQDEVDLDLPPDHKTTEPSPEADNDTNTDSNPIQSIISQTASDGSQEDDDDYDYSPKPFPVLDTSGIPRITVSHNKEQDESPTGSSSTQSLASGSGSDLTGHARVKAGSSILPPRVKSPSNSILSSMNFLSPRPFDRRILLAADGIGNHTPGSGSLGLGMSPRSTSPSVSSSPRRSLISNALSNLPSSQGESISRDESFVGLDEAVFKYQENDYQYEPVVWTKLRGISTQIYSESARHENGRPVCILPFSLLAVGTTRGYILLFDYNQKLVSKIGHGSRRIQEAGCITSLAVSSDQTHIAAGYETGVILVWKIDKPATPLIDISPISVPSSDHPHHNGHVFRSSIIHLNFVGKRHTVLVSADSKGMAFYHENPRTITGRRHVCFRLLGRYSLVVPSAANNKHTTVLSCAPLPIGNVSDLSEEFGLTAVMTPHVLAVVSTIASLQTHYKVKVPKSLLKRPPGESSLKLSGCLAWFPAMHIKSVSQTISPRLAFCWSNVLRIVTVAASKPSRQDHTGVLPHLEFQNSKQWVAEETIVAMKWANYRTLFLLTLSQKLLIMDETSMKISDSVDLISKQVHHEPLFSWLASNQGWMARRNHRDGNILDDYSADSQGENTIDGPLTSNIIDRAYFNSFKVFKGHLFILGSYELVMGSLSNWNDRLRVLTDRGDYIEAVTLATSFYLGEFQSVNMGLPKDDEKRRNLVYDKLLDTIENALSHCLLSSYSRRLEQNVTTEDGEPTVSGNSESTDPADLAEACLAACVAVKGENFLLDTLLDSFATAGQEIIFFDSLEQFIMAGQISFLPPTILKTMVELYSEKGWSQRLETIICRIDPLALDIDQTITLCRSNRLYEALCYIWNAALNDFVTPIVEFLKEIVQDSQIGSDANDDEKLLKTGQLQNDCVQLFEYIAYTLTSRQYPTGKYLSDEVSNRAKASVYGFIFSSSLIDWPPDTGRTLSVDEYGIDSNTSYPYLRVLLLIDGPGFLSALNEAFEDPFLNSTHNGQGEPLGNYDSNSNGNNNHKTNNHKGNESYLSRQYIVNVLLSVVPHDGKNLVSNGGYKDSGKESPNIKSSSYLTEIYLDMFIARNVPKFPQFILLTESLLHKVLLRLSSVESSAIQLEECELSVESLLSVYHPLDTMDKFIELWQEHKYFRVLEGVYKSEGQLGKLIDVYIQDSEHIGRVFDCLEQSYQTVYKEQQSTTIASRLKGEVDDAVKRNIVKLLETNAPKTVLIINSYNDGLHLSLIDDLMNKFKMPKIAYEYLETLFSTINTESLAGEQDTVNQNACWNTRATRELFIDLMCQFDPQQLLPFIKRFRRGDEVDLDNMIPKILDSGAVKAAILLLELNHKFIRALDEVCKHLETLMTSFLSDKVVPEVDIAERKQKGHQYPVDDLSTLTHRSANNISQSIIDEMHEFLLLGCKVCSQGCKELVLESNGSTNHKEAEDLWIRLVDIIINYSLSISSEEISPNKRSQLRIVIGQLVQDLFSQLMRNCTDIYTDRDANNTNNMVFLVVAKRFLHLASESRLTLKDLGSHLIKDLLTGFGYQRDQAKLALRLFSRDNQKAVFSKYRQQVAGWKVGGPGPRSSVEGSKLANREFNSQQRARECPICGLKVWGPGIKASELLPAWQLGSEKAAAERLVKAGYIVDVVRTDVAAQAGIGNSMLYKGKSPTSSPAFKSQSLIIPIPASLQDEPGSQNLIHDLEDPEHSNPFHILKSKEQQLDDNAGLGQNSQEYITRLANHSSHDSLIVFYCSHIYHESCLVRMGGKSPSYHCLVCNA